MYLYDIFIVFHYLIDLNELIVYSLDDEDGMVGWRLFKFILISLNHLKCIY